MGFSAKLHGQADGHAGDDGGTFLAAVLLWDILFRGQLGFSFSFLEEMWSRNLANLMISPPTPGRVRALHDRDEPDPTFYRRLAGNVSCHLFLRIQSLGTGIALAAFFANLLLTSWAIGLLCAGLVLRNGLGAEGLTWSIMFLFLPLTCVYYPVATLPVWLQPISWMLPPTAVFEGMRALMIENVFRADLMLWALGLNVIWITLAGWGFMRLMRSSKRLGSLLSVGE